MSNALATKRIIAQSLKHLMQTTPLKKISIQNIVDDCGLNRQTFYYHFQDIYDLIEWILATESLERAEEHAEIHGEEEAILGVLIYARENKSFFTNLAHSEATDALNRLCEREVYRTLMDALRTLAKGKPVTEGELDFIASFYTPAILHVLYRWIYDDMREDPQVIVERLSILLRGTFAQAVDRYAYQRSKA